MTIHTPSSAASAKPVAPAQACEAQAHGSRSVHSTELLKGDKTVEIVHNGAIYRLQSTKLGKLILTK